MAERELDAAALENIFREKDSRLTTSVRKYIGDLKETGQFDQIMSIGRTESPKKKDRQERIIDEVNRSIHGLLSTPDIKIEIHHQARAIWLMEAVGIIDSRQRLNDLSAIYDFSGPGSEDYLEELMPVVRDEVSNMLKSF